MRLPVIILVALVAAAVSQIVYFYPHLPDLVISHRGSHGPDGWLKKALFFWALAISELGTSGCFVAIAIAFPHLSKRWWNLPHKDYWHAPERRSNTARYVRTQLLWAAVIMQTAMVLLWQSTINANVRPELHWPANFWWTLIAVWVAFGLGYIRFYRHLNSVPSQEIHRK